MAAVRRVLTDPDEIRRWAEERRARPACVKGTEQGDTCVLRLDFPGYTGEESLKPISWDEWFRQFEKKNLALIVEDRTAKGQVSNFNKIVDRDTVEEARRRRRTSARASSRKRAPVRKRAAAGSGGGRKRSTTTRSRKTARRAR